MIERDSIDGAAVLQSVLESQLGIQHYAYIMTTYQSVNVAKNKEFQRRFNRFYRVRRDQSWRSNYYRIFEENKNNTGIRFEDILGEIYQSADERVEASFSSKMLATINPDMPIWDSNVLHKLGLELKGTYTVQRLNNAVRLYDEIVQWYREYMITEEARRNLDVFDTYLPEYKWISYVKKIDFLLWASG